MANEVADILIVGSGAAGGPFAWHLSSLSGVKIVCLEQGGWFGRPRTQATELEAQQQRLTTPAPAVGVRTVVDGYPYDYSESYWQPVLGNAVGGATVHYSGVWARLHPSDFRVKSLDGVADDWPISYWDIEPWYNRLDEIVGVAGEPGNTAYPPKPTILQPPHTLNRGAQILAKGFDQLGWHWWPVEKAIITRPFGNRAPCLEACESCEQGCPRESKNSSDVVFWPQAIQNGVELRTFATVREITVNRRGMADGVRYYDQTGTLREQRARLVVVACNGIGTPRLLLNSKSARFPDGIANSSGMVGRNLMCHPSATVVGLFDEDAEPLKVGDNSLVSDEFYETQPGRGFIRGMFMLSGAYSRPIRAALDRDPVPPMATIPAVLRLPANDGEPVPWGRSHHVAFAQRFQHSLAISMYGEELPLEDNRVLLDPVLKDQYGTPAPKLVLKRSDNTQKMLAFGMEKAQALLKAAGATRIMSSEVTTAAPGHYLGTARMGDDPKRSVVDKWCRSHDVKNLFVIDGSVFTTGAAAAPTATIQALSLRAADFVRNNYNDLKT